METVSLKGTREGLVLLLAPGVDYETARDALTERLDNARAFFEGGGTRTHIVLAGELPMPQLQALCGQMSGRYDLLDIVPERRIVTHAEDKPKLPSNLRESFALTASGTLRSGQRVSHHGDIVVLGDVNPGAELAAGGNIMVFGIMRGNAHAGALGDQDAIVVAFQLAPTLLRIAGVTGKPAGGDKPSYPELARLKDGRMVIEPYLPTRRG